MAFALISGARHSLFPPTGGTSNDAAGFASCYGPHRRSPLQGFRRWAPTPGVSPRRRQPATGPPGSYPDRTSTGRQRRAYEQQDPPWRYVTVSPPVLLGARKPEASRDPACMKRGIPAHVRIGRQLVPRGPRECCSYHSIDWGRAAAAAVSVARQVPAAAERMPSPLGALAFDGPDSAEFKEWEQQQEREFDRWQDSQDEVKRLLAASGLADREREAAASLLDPEDGIILGHLAGDERPLHYTGGMHRAHALLSAGVRWTVVLREYCCWPDKDCSPVCCSVHPWQPTRPTA
jgi:hypothetical protein